MVSLCCIASWAHSLQKSWPSYERPRESMRDSRAQNGWAAIAQILPSIFELRLHYLLVLLNFNSCFSPFWKRMGWFFWFFKNFYSCAFYFWKKMSCICFCCQVHAFSIHVGPILFLWGSFCCHAFSQGNIKRTYFPLQFIFCFYLFEVYNSVFI